VHLEVTIDSSGEVSDARVTSGPEELRKKALLTVLGWRFKPGADRAQVTMPFRAEAPPQDPGRSVTGAPRIRVSSREQSWKLTYKPDPEYPALARQARIGAVVRFHVVIDANGAPREIRVISGHPLLIAAAQNAVREYRYNQTLVNGTPVEVETEVELAFFPNN
jgi:protein TonB